MSVVGTPSTQEFNCCPDGPSQDEDLDIPDNCVLFGTNDACYINVLSPELLARLISFLPLQGRGRMMQVCKYLYLLSKEHFLLTRSLHSVDWDLFERLAEKVNRCWLEMGNAFDHVKTFDFMNFPLSMPDFTTLTIEGPFPHVKKVHLHLKLPYNKATISTIHTLFPSVEALHLYDFKKIEGFKHNVGDACMVELTKFAELKEFHCYFNRDVTVSDAGFDSLITCPKLEIVEFAGILVNVTDEKVLELANSHLNRVYLNHHRIHRLDEHSCLHPATNPRLRIRGKI